MLVAYKQFALEAGTVEGVNWDVGVNWDRILVTRHLCYCSLRDTGVQ